MITNKTFCLKNILKGGLPCPNAKITWIVPHSDCLTTPCDSCTDECIELTLLDDCDINCVHVRIECPDCDSCPAETHKVCFCNADGDCEVCETCSDAGVCVEKCEHCDPITGECGECSDNTDCPGDLECIQGKCQCPPGTTQDGTICRECSEDGECGPCKVCTENGKCVPKDCGSGVCDPTTGECVGCTNSGHCGPNEVCVDGECECAPGYVYDPIEGCIPAPPCETDGDCGPCMKCTEDGCVPRECPDGYVCYNDDCVKLCNCDEPNCDKANHGCQRISSDLCACLPCEDGGDCNEIPCEDGTDCPDGYGCQNGVCVPCDSLDCSTAECDDVLGCECLGTRCVDADNKCNGTCSGPEDCGEGCGCYHGKCVACDNFDCEDCADVPGCACNENTGRCEDDGLECSDTFEINKRDDNCAIEGILVTDKGCQCDRLSMGVKVQSVGSPNQFIRGINFLVELRKGDADEEGILNIPLLSQTGIANELPLSGNLQVRVVEKKRSSSYTTPVAEDVVFSQIFSLAGIDTLETGILNFNPPGFTKQDPVTGETVTVGEVEVEFILKRKTLNFENSCSYSEEDSVVRYRITADGGNGFIKYSQISGGTSTFRKHEVLESASNRNPIFSWYKSTTQGNETKFRSAYATEESPGYFRDGWISVAEGVEIGKFYRLESDCACDESVFYTCPNSGAISKLRYCNPNDLTQRLVYTLSDCNKTINLKAESNTFNVCQSNSIGGQVYELYLNGQKVDKDFTASNGQIVFSGNHTISTSITEIAIKLKDHNCDDCYEPIEVTNSEISIDLLEYDCETQALNFSLTGGSGNYSLTIDDVPTPLYEPIPLKKGEHTFIFTDISTGCTAQQALSVDCCAEFSVFADNISVCTGVASIDVNLHISGGVGPYRYVSNTPFALGQTNDTDVTINLTGYTGTTGEHRIIVQDLTLGCSLEVLYNIAVSDAPVITTSDTEFCSNGSPATTDVLVNITGSDDLFHYIITDPNTGNVVLNGEGDTAESFSIALNTNVLSYDIVATGVNSDCATEGTIELQSKNCVTPQVTVSSPTFCLNETDAILRATISGGEAPYQWTLSVNGNEISSCNGDISNACSNGIIVVNTGQNYTQNIANIPILVTTVDANGIVASGSGTITITNDPGVCFDGPVPTITIVDADGKGKNRTVGEDVELTTSSDSPPAANSLTWFEVGVTDAVGSNSSYFPSTQTVGSRQFIVSYEYVEGRTVESPPYTLTISEEPCDCVAAIKVVSGIPGLNGKTVTSANKNQGDTICYDNGPVNLQATLSGDCPSTSNVTWAVWRYVGSDVNNRLQFESGSGGSFQYNIAGGSSPTTLYVSMAISDSNCSASAQSFTVPISPCATTQPFSVGFTSVPSPVCQNETSSVPIKFRIQAGAKPGGGYDTFPFNWKLQHGTLSKIFKSGTSTWGSSSNIKQINETIDISNYVTPGSPMTLELKVTRTDQNITKNALIQISSSDPFSSACTTCADKGLSVSVQQGSTVEIVEGSSISLTAVPSVNAGYSVSIPSSGYVWTGGGVNKTGKTATFTPTQSTTYQLNVKDSQDCEAATSVTVNVTPACQPVNQTISWDTPTACPGDPVVLSWNITGTHSEYDVFVNGLSINPSNPTGTYNTTMITSGTMQAEIKSRFNGTCDLSTKTATVNLPSPATACCTLNSITIQGDDGRYCPGQTEVYTAVPNGSDNGYVYVWYDAASGGNVIPPVPGSGGKQISHTHPASGDSVVRVEATKGSCTKTTVKTFATTFGRGTGIAFLPAEGTEGPTSRWAISFPISSNQQHCFDKNDLTLNSLIVTVHPYAPIDRTSSATISTISGHLFYFADIDSGEFVVPDYSHTSGWSSMTVQYSVTTSTGDTLSETFNAVVAS